MSEDAPAEPLVERVERPDGRYILYFSWPEEPAAPGPPVEGGDPDPDE